MSKRESLTPTEVRLVLGRATEHTDEQDVHWKLLTYVIGPRVAEWVFEECHHAPLSEEGGKRVIGKIEEVFGNGYPLGRLSLLMRSDPLLDRLYELRHGRMPANLGELEMLRDRMFEVITSGISGIAPGGPC